MAVGIDKVVSLEVEKGVGFEIPFQQMPELANGIIVRPPLNGRLSETASGFLYEPKPTYLGEDFFTVKSKTGGACLIALTIRETVFKPRARLLIQLGNQLIKNESIALVELAKNSFDADASHCNVTMRSVESTEQGVIIVEDDGFGMDIRTVRNAWLEPGSDNKEILVKDKQVTPKYHRLPIGEKGIGRFGVHKLGKRIEMISRKDGCKEVVVRIDWEEFEKYKYLNQAPVQIFERDPEVFSEGTTGTRITISKLSKPWTRGMVRDIYRALNGISTPPTYDIDEFLEQEKAANNKKKDVDRLDSFEANLIGDPIVSEWTKDIPSWKEILRYALFFFDIEIDGDRITEFKYNFKPWENFGGIEPRSVPIEEVAPDLLELTDPSAKRKFKPLNIGDLAIGKFRFKGCVFVRDRFIFKAFGIQPGSLTDYLDANGGIRVYRNGIRVYDYGERGNDWLALDYRRFNDPGVKLSNNLMLASVSLDRESSTDLIEKTNREGFIDNEAYEIFKKQITYALKMIELERLKDKRIIDEKFKPKKENEPVLKSIDGLKSLIEEKVQDKKIKKELNLYVDRIEKNYRFMNDTLIKAASAGLGWSVYIHEIEKIITEIVRVLKKDNASERMIRLTLHLSELIESYAQVLRRSEKLNQNISKIIDQALFNVAYRLEAHGVKIVREDLNKPPTSVLVTKNLMVSNIMNIIDNSMYWLDRSKKDNKQIRFDIEEVEDGYVSLVISDNGTGFTLTAEQMIEPFMSAKPGGMGLGLHIVSEVMSSLGGRVTFNEDGNYDVPDEFKGGATVMLNFKK